MAVAVAVGVDDRSTTTLAGVVETGWGKPCRSKFPRKKGGTADEDHKTRDVERTATWRYVEIYNGQNSASIDALCSNRRGPLFWLGIQTRN